MSSAVRIIVGDDTGVIKVVSTASKTVVAAVGVPAAKHGVLSLVAADVPHSVVAAHEGGAYSLVDPHKERILCEWKYVSAGGNPVGLARGPDPFTFVTCDPTGAIVMHSLIRPDGSTPSVTDAVEVFATCTAKISPLMELRRAQISRFRCDWPYAIIGGQEVDLVVLDLAEKKILHRAKNLAPDATKIAPRVWPTDFAFMELGNPDHVVACTAYGELRIYDFSGETRKPKVNLKAKNKDDEMACGFMTLLPLGQKGHYLLGSKQGDAYVMNNKQTVRRLRGPTGSLRALGRYGNLVAIGGLDRFIRVYVGESTAAAVEVFVKTRVNCLIVVDDHEQKGKKKRSRVEKEEEEQEEVEEDDEEVEAKFWNSDEEEEEGQEEEEADDDESEEESEEQDEAKEDEDEDEEASDDDDEDEESEEEESEEEESEEEEEEEPVQAPPRKMPRVQQQQQKPQSRNQPPRSAPAKPQPQRQQQQQQQMQKSRRR